MRRLARFFLFVASAVWLAAPSAAQTVTIHYKATDFQTVIVDISQVETSPFPTNGAFNDAVLIQYFPKLTRANTPSLTNGEFYLSNCIPSVVYRSIISARGGDQPYSVLVPTNAIGGSTISAAANLVSTTNHTADGLFAFSAGASDARYLFRVTPSVIGYVPIATDIFGDYVWGPMSGGSGGSATNAYQSQAGNNLITIATNAGTFVYTISGVSQTNGYPWGTLYDPANSAHNATNGYPWGSLYDAAGLAVSVTNGYPWGSLYDPAGRAVAITNGYPWGVLYDAAGTAQTVANASSNSVLANAQTAINSSSNALQGQITSGGVTLTQLNTTSNSVYGNALSQINTSSNAVLANAQTAINTSSNSVAGSAQTIANTSSNTIVSRTITVNGTANQITSSAGAQDLSANRVWTLSLPSTLILPGALNVPSSVTNQSTVSTTGNSTNFGASYYLGGLFSFAVPVLTGASNLNAANITGTIPHGSLPSFVLTNSWQGTITANGFSGGGSGLTSLTGANLLGPFAATLTTNNGTLSGIMKGDGSRGVTAATAGTDYSSPTSTDTFQNKTFDAAATGNVLKQFRSLKFSFPRLIDGTGCTFPNTNDFTANTFMVPRFAGNAVSNANFCRFAVRVPSDIDTSVDLTASITVRLSAADTGAQRYHLGMVSIANSAAAAGTAANFVSLTVAADASGASGDVESINDVTLTSWKSNVTAKQWLLIELRRAGDDAADTSTVASDLAELEIFYTSTQ